MKNVYGSIVIGLILVMSFAAVAQDAAAPAAQDAAAPAAQDAAAAPAATPAMSDEAKTAYALGAQIGQSLKRMGVEIDFDGFVKGMKDSLGEGPLALSEDEMRNLQMEFRKNAAAKQQEQMQKDAEENLAKQKEYMDANGKKEGVVTLPSGLQYRVITEGTGAIPTATDQVKVNYRGTLVDGTEFDSSYSRGEPATFPVRGVIPGWTEALQLMPVGSKWELVIPGDLAYGMRGGAGGKIGPNAMLIFEVELLDIVTPPPGQAPQNNPNKIIVEPAKP